MYQMLNFNIKIILFLCFNGLLFSKEQILKYETELSLNKDGSLFIIENITVKAEGNKIQRGITREFPTKYKNKFGDNIVIDLEIIDILKNNIHESFFVKNKSNGKIIYIGNKDVFLKHGNYTYTLKYKINRQIGFYEHFDELYYNVIGTGWSFPINNIAVKLSLPPDAEIIKQVAYTGSKNQVGKNYISKKLSPNIITYKNLKPFLAYEGLTIAVSFPKGIIKEPTKGEKTLFYLNDNIAILIIIMGYLILLFYYLFAWKKVGKDPEKGTIIAQYKPPLNFSPAIIRYILNMEFDKRCFSAAMVNMARKGYLDIINDDDDFKLSKKSDDFSLLSKGEKILAKKLFIKNNVITLKNTENIIIRKAIHSFKKALKNELNTNYFNANAKWVFPGIGISLTTTLLSFIVMDGLTFTILASIIILLITNILFTYLMKAPTMHGRKIMDQIEGFKLYLSIAEANRLNLLNPPKKTPNLFEKFLPYAIALNVENEWGDQFNSILSNLDEENNSYQPHWYHGYHSSRFSVNNFTSSIGKSFSSAISSAATPPGSSSASGGGGFAGGGGGGGGGGGW